MTCVTVTSAGNSLPSARKHRVSRRLPIISTPPVTAGVKKSRRRRSLREEGRIVWSRSLPKASDREIRNVLSEAALKSVILDRSSAQMMQSRAKSRSACLRVSLARNSRWARSSSIEDEWGVIGFVRNFGRISRSRRSAARPAENLLLAEQFVNLVLQHVQAEGLP